MAALQDELFRWRKRIKMIQQHYYTRDRKGIFSRTPGYDTVAKSKNLEDDFVINTLHDLCFYEAPSSLVGEEDMLKYPTALFCINTEDNRMVVGQSVFAGKDYTGQRNRYFTHNYIIPEEERNKYIENPEKMIFSTGFMSDYNLDKGALLPEVFKIENNNSEDCFSSIEEMFLATDMSKETFLNLIKASFDGAKHGKNIYIVLDSDNKSITTLAKGILKYLYRAIPFEVRKKIGFITYMKEPKNKNLINIIFLCKGSIKRLTTEIKAGYVFDLADSDFYLDGIDEENHLFIEYVMKNIENKEILKDFFYEADKGIISDKLNIYEYDNILKPIDEKKNYKDTLSTEDKISLIETKDNSNTKYEKEKKENNTRSIYAIWRKIKNIINKNSDGSI